mgnify:CR=1 FL=1
MKLRMIVDTVMLVLFLAILDYRQIGSSHHEMGVRIFFWTILVVLTLSLSFLCILLDSCRPR